MIHFGLALSSRPLLCLCHLSVFTPPLYLKWNYNEGEREMFSFEQRKDMALMSCAR